MKRYVEDQDLPIDILVDDSRATLDGYGVWQPQATGGASIVRPALFLVDRNGLVRYRFVAQWQHEFPAFEEIAAAVGDVVRGGQVTPAGEAGGRA